MRNNRVSNINDGSHFTNSIEPIDKNLFIRTTNINLDSKNFDKYSNKYKDKSSNKPIKLYLRRNTKIYPADLNLKHDLKEYSQSNRDDNRYDNRYENRYENRYDNRYENRYENKYQNRYENRYENRYGNIYNKKYGNTHDYEYDTDMKKYYQNDKSAYEDYKNRELEEYMKKFDKTPEYNKYIRNLSDSDSEKMNKA